MAPFGSSFDGLGGSGNFGAGVAIAILVILIDVPIAGLIAIWVILIIAARFLKNGYEGIATKTGARYLKPNRDTVTFLLWLTTPGK
jgi:uncharacterized membrane protein